MRTITYFLLLATTLSSLAHAQGFSMREDTLKAIVQVSASSCLDHTLRRGTGFLYQTTDRVVTAHHVVGGCSDIQVQYEVAPANSKRVYVAKISKVLAKGDLALLEVQGVPQSSVLRVLEKNNGPLGAGAQHLYGYGYPLGVQTASDQEVQMAVGDKHLNAILPAQAAIELNEVKSKIDTSQPVLRFSSALQPGMSGGPIVNAQGRVVGVVAGGLKSGAAPVSWGWDASNIDALLASGEPLNQPVTIAHLYYTQNDLVGFANAFNSGERQKCGDLYFVNTGTQTFDQLKHGADDYPRLQYILGISGQSLEDLNKTEFSVWVSPDSGATAIVPKGYDLLTENYNDQVVCVAKSLTGGNQQLIWGVRASNPNELQFKSSVFENAVIFPKMPYMSGFRVDRNLTTFVTAPNGAYGPGPVNRPNGLIFNRKGFIFPKEPIQYPYDKGVQAFGFDTLVAQSGYFLGVASINQTFQDNTAQCKSTNYAGESCAIVKENVEEWVKFLLATQLSTFPAL